MQPLRALYYPFSRCLDENHLKRLILVFDEVWFLDALAQHAQLQYGNVDLWFSRHPLALVNACASGVRYFRRDFNDELARQDWNRIRDSYQLLLSKGLINSYNPTRLVQQYDTILSASWLSDILFLDRGAFEGCIGYTGFGGATGGTDTSSTTWQTLRSRIPNSLFSLLEPVDRLKLYANSLPSIRNTANAATDDLPFCDYRLKSDANLKDSLLSEIARAFRKDIDTQLREVWRTAPTIDRKERAGFGAMIRTLELDGHAVVRLPFDWGAALCLNQALLIADLEGFALTTSENVCHNVLLAKYRMAAKSRRATRPGVLFGESSEHLGKFTSLALNIISRLLPDEALEHRTIEEIITYRERAGEMRGRFLKNIHTLTSEIESNIWEGEFPDHVRKRLRQVEKEAQIYSDSLTQIYEDMFGNSSLVKRAGLAVGPSLIGTVLRLSPGDILLLACGGLAAAVGTLLPDLLKHWQEKRKARRNYLAYVLELPK